jgi:hypothetical protein
MENTDSGMKGVTNTEAMPTPYYETKQEMRDEMAWELK